MSEIRRVVICGAGAMGSVYAARIHALDPDGLVVVAKGERRARLEREGLTVNGRSFRVRCLSPDEPGAAADLVIVAVKHHHLPSAIEDVRGFVGDQTLLMSLLNGVTSEEALGRAFGREKVLYAYEIRTDAVRNGTTTRHSNEGHITLGVADGDRSDPRVSAVCKFLERAKISHDVPDDIVRGLWWKFMFNVGVNQVSAVLRAPYGAFADVPEVRALTRLASLEAIAVAERQGVHIAPSDVDAIFPILARLTRDGKTSMLQDVEAGRKTEVELFAGTVVELGRRHGIPTPVNELLGQMIAALEQLGAAGTNRR